MNYYFVGYESIKGKSDDVHGKLMVKASSYEEAQNKFFDWLKSQSFYPNMQRIFVSIEEVTDPIIS